MAKKTDFDRRVGDSKALRPVSVTEAEEEKSNKRLAELGFKVYVPKADG